MLRGNKTIGILREVKNKWERRAPLAPKHVEKLIKDDGLRVLVQVNATYNCSETMMSI